MRRILYIATEDSLTPSELKQLQKYKDSEDSEDFRERLRGEFSTFGKTIRFIEGDCDERNT